MHLVKEEETGRMVYRPAYFPDMKTLIQGAYSFASFFEKMHLAQKVYVGNDPSDFRISLDTGEMEYRGEDGFQEASEEGEVVVSGQDAILINEFAAPELILAYKEGAPLHYNDETDRYFISVFLFEYFFHTGSPFEGKKMVNRCFLSPLEKEVFRADQGVFCMDTGDHENYPVKGIQDKLIRYWKAYPDFLHKMFLRAFMNGGASTFLRPSAVDWMRVMIHLTMDYKECACGYHGFSFSLPEQENGTRLCPRCGKVFYPLTNGMDTLWLSEGQKLYECQTGRIPFDKEKVTGIVVENRQRKGLYGIKNLGTAEWRGMFPDGRIREIGRNQAMPIWNGMRIRFELGEDWFLRLKCPDKIPDAQTDELTVAEGFMPSDDFI
ncbi:MAG: hypothetical protein IKX76_03525 [Eubacterium sp.]|nr:hypothetical protein [Eubacterium sp.]